jgi:quercetin dioxygenase-like cupin family protein
MSAFDDLRELAPKQIWEGIHARIVPGERLSLTVVELDPNAVVGEHSHPHEQLGLVLAGAIRFRVGEETKELGPGESWTIPGNTPHEATAGPDGAVLVDVFTPVREDWQELAAVESRPPRWP